MSQGVAYEVWWTSASDEAGFPVRPEWVLVPASQIYNFPTASLLYHQKTKMKQYFSPIGLDLMIFCEGLEEYQISFRFIWWQAMAILPLPK